MNATSSTPQPETSDLYVGRITQMSFEAVIGATYGFAMITAMARLMLQFKAHRRFFLDDWLLVFATVCLTTSTVIGYVKVKTLYWSQELNYNEFRIIELISQHVDLAAHMNAFQRLYYTYPTVLWLSIFAIKFAYLAFLRRLVDRIKPLIGHWRIVVCITSVSFPVCIISVYVNCDKWGLDAVNCIKPIYFHRALALSILDAFLDIGTDLLIISLPIRLLWSVRIQLRQKIILGIFLSLNVFMGIMACARVSGVNFHGRFDEVWLFIWQHVEACVAVTMVSVTAFRSAYVGSESLQRRKDRAMRRWYSSSLQPFRRKKAPQQSDGEAMLGMPCIPGETLSGMQTFIEGGKHTETVEGTGIHKTTSWKTDWA